jgi:spermidine synthase
VGGCFFLSVTAVLVYEVLWIRMIDKVIGSAPFAVAAVLTTFMAGLALESYKAVH